MKAIFLSLALLIFSLSAWAQQPRLHAHAQPSSPQPVALWQPGLNTSWQWQLSTPVDQSVNVQMYDIDMFDNDASVVASLHAAGRKVVCYIDVGTWENWRPDAGKFPNSVKGKNNGWPGEKWLDIRQISILGPIMQARMDQCRAKGFDALEPDNIDGYSNSTGFPLTYQDQVAYNTYIATQAHARGLAVALKNDLEQVPDLLSSFDFALDEQCFQYNECNLLLPFISANKAVFEVEYKMNTNKFCPSANAMNFNSMKKHLSLDAYRVPCR
ncbi:MAG: endo alpha-1,4 polygalactosaminidase [Acidobacteriia bacterium]|nr:endo alpha-1,4 polygalactosaminidase [Terriglobia bacterium]